MNTNQNRPLEPKEIKHINKQCGERKEVVNFMRIFSTFLIASQINIYLQGSRTECLPVLNGVHLAHLQEKVQYARLIRQLSERLEEAKQQLKAQRNKNSINNSKRSYSCVSFDDESSVPPAQPDNNSRRFAAPHQSNEESTPHNPSMPYQQFLSLPDLMSRFNDLTEENTELKKVVQAQWSELHGLQQKYKELQRSRLTLKEPGEVSTDTEDRAGVSDDRSTITVIGH